MCADYSAAQIRQHSVILVTFPASNTQYIIFACAHVDTHVHTIPTPTHRFEIAVNDFLSVQQFEAVQHGVGKLANERDTEALEVILFDELIKIHPSRGWGPVNKADQ